MAGQFSRLPFCEAEIGSERKEGEGHKVIPFQRFAQICHGKYGKNAERNHLLDRL
jgi:hypothetical protein